MIDKRLRYERLHVSIPERYPLRYDKEYTDPETGLVRIQVPWVQREMPPFEIATILQIGDGIDKNGERLTDVYSVGDKVKIKSRTGRDYNTDDKENGYKNTYTTILDSDVVAII